MKKISLLLFFVLYFISASSLAWEPCVPFCDSECGGKALKNLGTSVADAMKKQYDMHIKLLESIKKTDQSIINLKEDLAETWTKSTADLIKALDSKTARIELKNLAKDKAIGCCGAKKQTQVLTDTIRNKQLLKKMDELDWTFSKKSQPESGEIGTKRAGQVKKSYNKSLQNAAEISKEQDAYIESKKPGNLSILTQQKLTEDIEMFNSALLFQRHTLSDEEMKSMQELVSDLTSNMLPTPSSTDLLTEKRLKLKEKWVRSILNTIVTSKQQLAATDWVRTYTARSSSESGMSYMETIASVIDGRIASEGWYIDMSSSNDVGLQREMTYLKAEENSLLFLLSQRREWRNQLLALIAATKSQVNIMPTPKS